jgi:hypothetical protein
MRRFARKRKRAEHDATAETTTAPAPTARLHLGERESRLGRTDADLLTSERPRRRSCQENSRDRPSPKMNR